MPHNFVPDSETPWVLLLASGGFTAMFSNLDIIIKLIIGLITIVYVGYKTLNEINKYNRNKEFKKTNKDGQDNTK